ncbi:MAG: 2-keto-4-pentenoate hydratase [Alphaproteobacteria bacterium]|nr:2-keto-4-pentenoate hydratase [Alphaproteobacteria bacterium]
MDQAKVARVAELLFQARAARHEIVPAADDMPSDLDESYAIQETVARRLGAIGGWKTGAGLPTAEPSAAPLYTATMFQSPARLPADRFGRLGLEAEIAYRFGRDLPARVAPYGEDEVLAAIATLHPAIEVVDTRLKAFPDIDRRWQVADNAANGGFVYGPGVAEWRRIDVSRLASVLTIDGKVAVSTVGGNKAVDLVRLLVWVANHRRARGAGLKAGDFVTTGSYTGLIFTHPGAVVRAEFPGVGAVDLTYAA